MAPWWARVGRRGLAVAALATTLITVGLTAPAEATPAPVISFSGISFDPQQVDTTSDPTVALLNWTVTDPNTSATQIHGTVQLQRFIGVDPVGPVLPVNFSLYPDYPAWVYANAGNAQSSTYSYEFVVPQYGPASTVTWRVVGIEARDNQGTSGDLDARELADRNAALTVTELVDSTAPEPGPAALAIGQRNVVFDDDGGAVLRYQVNIADSQSGFWKGRLFLTGPAGVTAVGSFGMTYIDDYLPYCGQDDPVIPLPESVWCGVAVELPPGSPAGTWSVSKIALTDQADNTRSWTGLPALPIRVTRNQTLTASDFTISPTEVDNWRTESTVTLTLKPSGTEGGLTSVSIESNGGCYGLGTTPTINADGTASIPVQVSRWVWSCAITGIVLTDSAGHVAVYGSYYDAPGLDLVVDRIPDTSPPVVVAASLSTTTVSAQNLPPYIGVVVTVEDTPLAPVDSSSTTVFNAEGVSVGGGMGSVPPATAVDGKLTVTLLASSRLVPGTYTVGFTLTDAAGNSSSYGYPNGGQPAPSGPLILTVTE